MSNYITKKNKIQESDLVTVIRKSISLGEVNEYIENSQILLDIQQKNQLGLSFRVFESLGLEKKLITTNIDVKNYDIIMPIIESELRKHINPILGRQ